MKTKTTTTKKPLSFFRHMHRCTVAELEGMKQIMRIETPRQYQWWLVLPATEIQEDGICILLKKAPKWESMIHTQEGLLISYGERIAKIHGTHSRKNFPHLYKA